MINANEFGNIMNDVKIEKFNRMVAHQEKIIRENMKQGYNSVLWIFMKFIMERILFIKLTSLMLMFFPGCVIH